MELKLQSLRLEGARGRLTLHKSVKIPQSMANWPWSKHCFLRLSMVLDRQADVSCEASQVPVCPLRSYVGNTAAATTIQVKLINYWL